MKYSLFGLVGFSLKNVDNDNLHWVMKLSNVYKVLISKEPVNSKCSLNVSYEYYFTSSALSYFLPPLELSSLLRARLSLRVSLVSWPPTRAHLGLI